MEIDFEPSDTVDRDDANGKAAKANQPAAGLFLIFGQFVAIDLFEIYKKLSYYSFTYYIR